MTRRIEDLIGQRFGRVVIIGKGEYGGYDSCWVQCQCDCGTLFSTLYSSLRRGATRSCGCLRREVNRAPRATKPVRGITPDGKIVEYPSIREAASAVGVSPDGLSRVLHGKQHTAGDCIWEFISTGNNHY